MNNNKKKTHRFSYAEQGTKNVYGIVSNVAQKWGIVYSHFTTGSNLSSITKIFVGEASTSYNILIQFGLHKCPSRGKQYFHCVLMQYQIWYSLNTYLGSNVDFGLYIIHNMAYTQIGCSTQCNFQNEL